MTIITDENKAVVAKKPAVKKVASPKPSLAGAFALATEKIEQQAKPQINEVVLMSTLVSELVKDAPIKKTVSKAAPKVNLVKNVEQVSSESKTEKLAVSQDKNLENKDVLPVVNKTEKVAPKANVSNFKINANFSNNRAVQSEPRLNNNNRGNYNNNGGNNNRRFNNFNNNPNANRANSFRSNGSNNSELNPSAAALAEARPVRGILDNSKEGNSILRVNFAEGDNDIYVNTGFLRRYRLRAGDIIEGLAREPKENDRYWGLLQIDRINDLSIDEYNKIDRVKFHNLTPVYPDEQIKLELSTEPLSLRIIDLIAPIGKGQRSLIVSPPKAGKTTLIKDIATGVAKNHPEIHVMAVLVGERPEEVTDIGRHIARITDGKGEVAASNFDEPADQQCAVAELALERAKRVVEEGRDVLILLDSITRLARAYNLSIPTSGRTLSGGFDPAALFPPKKFFGAARNFERQGSLTIVGTALVDTGSRMDDLVYEEFKGTGNQEVHLDRHLAERRIFPGIEVQKSGTRRDDLLFDPVTYQSIMTLHQMLDILDRDERTITLIGQLKKAKTNKEFLAGLRAGF